jgi:hypothetical protein
MSYLFMFLAGGLGMLATFFTVVRTHSPLPYVLTMLVCFFMAWLNHPRK